MKRFSFLFVLFFFLILLLPACHRQQVEKIPWKEGFIRLVVVRDDILHVTVSPTRELNERPSLVIDGDPVVITSWDKKEDEHFLTLTTSRLVARLNKRTGELRITRHNGTPVLCAGAPRFTPFTLRGEEDTVYSILQSFRPTSDESLYGLGQHQDGVVDLRGHDRTLFQENTIAAVPFLVSTNNYGILWDNYSLTRFHDGQEGMTMWSKVADAVDYYVVTGDDLDGVIAGYRHLTGKPPLYGRWAYGYWQSRERYHTQYELTKVVREYRRRGLPLDNIVQDWMYWGRHGWNALQFDSTRFPHPREMIDTVHQLHAHIMISVWPNFGKETEVYREMKERGFLITGENGQSRGLYDPYNPAARDFYWHWLEKNLFSLGIDAWWMDATEPEVGGLTLEERVAALEGLGRTALGPLARYLNTYSLMSARGVYEHQRQRTDRKRVYILTRSAWAGQQRYAATTWSGDIHARWDVFRNQITAGIHFSLSGLPYWTTDIGAFLPDNPLGNRDNAYRELYLRWFQFGAFCPIFRSHGSGTPREIYRFGGEKSWTYAPLRRFDRLRYRLLPYLYSLAWQVTAHDYTLMRGLAMDFPGDTLACRLGDEYMFGPAFLVAPVTRPLYFHRNYTGAVLPPAALRDEQGRRGGLTIRFFNGTGLDTLVATGRITRLDVDWNDGSSRPPTVHPYHYSIRMNGTLLPPESGIYTFVTTSNDGIRLIVGDTTVIENWTPHGATIDMGEIRLEKDKNYPFTVEYFQTLGSAVTRIAWIPPSVRDTLHEQEIPPVRPWEVYLPAGTAWYDFWRGIRYPGGQHIRVPAPLDEMPLFVREGTILPMGPPLQWADQHATDTLELRIYPGQNGSFTLYEDENDNYNYEKGTYALTPITWDEKSQTLTLAKRKGSFPGMSQEHTFRIVWVDKDHGAGPRFTSCADTTVRYTGRTLTVARPDKKSKKPFNQQKK